MKASTPSIIMIAWSRLIITAGKKQAHKLKPRAAYSACRCDQLLGSAQRGVYLEGSVSAAGWLLFMIFCGAGLVALPLDMIREFLGRPKVTIPKSEYMTRAKALGNKAKGIMVLPPLLHTSCACHMLPAQALSLWLSGAHELAGTSLLTSDCVQPGGTVLTGYSNHGAFWLTSRHAGLQCALLTTPDAGDFLGVLFFSSALCCLKNQVKSEHECTSPSTERCSCCGLHSGFSCISSNSKVLAVKCVKTKRRGLLAKRDPPEGTANLCACLHRAAISEATAEVHMPARHACAQCAVHKLHVQPR